MSGNRRGARERRSAEQGRAPHGGRSGCCRPSAGQDLRRAGAKNRENRKLGDGPMNDLEEQQRMERRKLKVGDRVAIVGRYGRIDVQTVTANCLSRIVVGRVEYWTASGSAV